MTNSPTTRPEQSAATARVFTVIGETLTLARDAISVVGTCPHLPELPTNAPTSPTEAYAHRAQANAFLDHLRAEECFCHHGMPGQLIATIALNWRTVVEDGIWHARSYGANPTLTAINEQRLTDSTEALRKHTEWITSGKFARDLRHLWIAN